LIPLLFRLERRTRGNYLTDTVADVGPTPAVLSPLGGPGMDLLGWFGPSGRVRASGLVELFLFGPRLILDTLDRMRARRALHDIDRVRCAQALLRLLSSDPHTPAASLLDPGQSIDDILPILRYLYFHDWIGVSADLQRIWILSDARRTLVAAPH
jgi:hypothetical protein